MGNNGIISECNFINNSAIYSAGAIYWLQSSANGTVTNCNFSNNRGKWGGAIRWETSSNGKIINCDFLDCKSMELAGAIYWRSSNYGEISNCTFINCSSDDYAGAVYWREGKYGLLSNCTFINCSADGYAGAVYWTGDDGKILNCIFDNITLDSSISEVIDVSATNTEIKYCTIKNNDLYNSVYVDGYYNISGTLNLEKNNFDGFIRIQDGGILSPIYLILTSEIGLPSNIIGLKAIIQDDNENSIVINKKLTFLISDGSEIIASGNKGIWTATHTFNQTGSYHISATISNFANLTVNEIDVNIGIPSKFAYVNLSGDLKIIALLLSEQGNPIAYGNITYIIDNVVYNTATDSSGLVNIQNISGKTITLKYEGDNVYNPTNISLILSNITPAKTSSKFNIASGKVIKIYAVDYSTGERGKDVKFRLTDVNGNPIAGAIVNIAFKTSNYKKVSDANGYVKLAISSSASGKYLSVISFLGDAEYDPVVVPFTFNIVKKTVTINAKAKLLV